VTRRTLEQVRAELDRTDRALVELLAARASLVREAFEIKQASGAGLRDAAREKEIADAVVLLGRTHGLPESDLREVFAAILRFTRVVSDPPGR
jgi:chorismate mutase